MHIIFLAFFLGVFLLLLFWNWRHEEDSCSGENSDKIHTFSMCENCTHVLKVVGVFYYYYFLVLVVSTCL